MGLMNFISALKSIKCICYRMWHIQGRINSAVQICPLRSTSTLVVYCPEVSLLISPRPKRMCCYTLDRIEAYDLADFENLWVSTFLLHE